MTKVATLAAICSLAYACPSTAQTQYCSAGLSMANLADHRSADPAAIFRDCVPGDTVAIPANYPSLIARTCDFSKSIVSTPGYVLCVIGALRSTK